MIMIEIDEVNAGMGPGTYKLSSPQALPSLPQIAFFGQFPVKRRERCEKWWRKISVYYSTAAKQPIRP